MMNSPPLPLEYNASHNYDSLSKVVEKKNKTSVTMLISAMLLSLTLLTIHQVVNCNPVSSSSTPSANNQEQRQMINARQSIIQLNKFKSNHQTRQKRHFNNQVTLNEMKNSTSSLDKSGSVPTHKRSSQIVGQQKRFKTAFDNINLGSSRLRESTRVVENNSEIVSNTSNSTMTMNDINNNSISSSGDQQEPIQRNINSINGTIDLSQYNQNDVDRLYGDALLVYFRNFNETLPARRATIVLNETDNHHRLPIYQSDLILTTPKRDPN